jgi:hypothetical protein
LFVLPDGLFKVADIEAEGVAQVIEHLPSKCKALNSN